ncbi:MAG: thiamine phosphate synthase [Deltaproteobacteria bacterium]|nr:thiamine phosphate synthase [Deltaproteobacteria bacterium]
MPGVGERLYLITDGTAKRDTTRFLEKIDKALSGGARLIQIREKDLSARELLGLAKVIKEKAARYGALVLINDRADIALLAGADGVHITGAGYAPCEARNILGPKAVIGVSTHSIIDAGKAEKEGADFVTFGPVYFTESKAAYGEPLGIAKLREAASAIKVPVFALGGVTTERVKEAVSNGAFGVAVISAVFGSYDIEKSVKGFLEVLYPNIQTRGQR